MSIAPGAGRGAPSIELLADDLDLHPDRSAGLVGGVAADAGDRLDDVGAAALAEDGVFPVELLVRELGDEELRAAGVAPGVGHGEPTGAIERERSDDLVRQAVAGTAGADLGM